jgi:hypothetical protein
VETPFALWVYLSATPLLWLTLTVVVWVFADGLAQLAGRNPLVNPVMITIVAISVLLMVTGTPYGTYFNGAQFVYFLLGPATVAIALPLYKNWSTVRRKALPMLDDGDRFRRRGGGGVGRAAGRAGFVGAQVGHGGGGDEHLRPSGRPPLPDSGAGRHYRRAGRRHRDPADERHGRA